MFKKILSTVCLSASSMMIMAQNKVDVAKGLTEATNQVSGIFGAATNLLYAVCAIMAIIGAFHVYSKWTSGDPDVTKAAAGWIGGLIFVGVAIFVIKTAFGIQG